MPILVARCCCIRTQSYSETSQIVTMFCREQGVVRLMAKGSRRRTVKGNSLFDGGVNTLDTGVAVFVPAKADGLGTLCEWTVMEARPWIRQNLRPAMLGLLAAEVIAACTEPGDPHPKSYDALVRLLDARPGQPSERAFLDFLATAVSEAGLMPSLADQEAVAPGRSSSGPRDAGDATVGALLGHLSHEIGRRFRLARYVLR